MKIRQAMGSVSAMAVIALVAGCSTWDGMNHKEKDTTVGAGSGAVAGAVVAGPVGAVVGAVGGGIAGHEVGKTDDKYAPRTDVAYAPRTTSDSTYVRSVQQALADRGYSTGQADGRWGPSTQEALRRFQSSRGMQATGQLDSKTVAALGV